MHLERPNSHQEVHTLKCHSSSRKPFVVQDSSTCNFVDEQPLSARQRISDNPAIFALVSAADVMSLLSFEMVPVQIFFLWLFSLYWGSSILWCLLWRKVPEDACDLWAHFCRLEVLFVTARLCNWVRFSGSSLWTLFGPLQLMLFLAGMTLLSLAFF